MKGAAEMDGKEPSGALLKAYRQAFYLGMGLMGGAALLGLAHDLRVFRRLPGTVPDPGALAERLIEQNKVGEAIGELRGEAAVVREQGGYEKIALLGRLAGDAEAQIDALKGLLNFKREGQTYKELGSACLFAGRNEEAIANLTEALRYDSHARDPETLTRLGSAFQAGGDLKKAVAAYSRAVEADPNYADGYFGLGGAMSAAGRAGEARRFFEAALRANPAHIEALNNLGIMQAQAGDPEGAAKRFEAAVAAKPDDARSHGNLGVALEQLGRLAEATHHYAEAARLEPGNAKAKQRLEAAQGKATAGLAGPFK